MRLLAVAFAAVLHAVLGGQDPKRPNFIFFQPDEMRAESLGCYGHPIVQTPNLDAFAKESTRFDQAHVSYTVCSQSRVAFMTGWPTHVAGHRSLWALLHEWEPNMLKYFKSAGYTVKWWGKNDMLADDAWNSSVTSAMSYGGSDNGPNSFSLDDPRYYSFLNDPTKSNSTGDYNNVAAAIDFLASEPEEPFVIFLPLLKPHPPYSAPEPWYSSVKVEDVPPLRPHSLPGKPDYHALIRQYRNITRIGESGGESSDQFLRRLHAVYLGSISYVDWMFGLLMAALDKSQYKETTTVAVWADHGDYAGDYGLVEKWPSGLEDVLTRVPLMIRTPGGAKGHVVKEPVQLFDIVPTMLQIADINVTHVHFATSQVPQLHGAAGDSSRAVFAEGGYSSHEPRDVEGNPANGGIPDASNIYYPKLMQQTQHPLSVCRAVSVRTQSHKLIFRSDQLDEDHDSELYDLEADPLELNNVYGNSTYLAVRESLKSKMFRWMMQTSDVTPWNLDNRNGQPGGGGVHPPSPWPPRRLPMDIVQDTAQIASNEPVFYGTGRM